MKSVIKGVGYILAHTPDMVLRSGTTQTTERIVNPESEYLKALPAHLRSFEQALSYWPNQVYIGNKTPAELAAVEQPWYDKTCDVSERFGKFGQIMPQEEFFLLLQSCDVFDLVKLDRDFVAAYKSDLAANPLMDETILARIQDGIDGAEIARLVEQEHSEGLYHHDRLVGCVNRAHDIDGNLSAHVMMENLVSKASSVLALLTAVKNAGIEKEQVDYVIDCAEEACGDMNQRGGGNFAKAAAEIAGLLGATGSDLRSFCAAPAHAMIEAAALVQAGAYKTVVVTAGGCTAKLGMNGKDHVKKGLPILEDMVAGFAVVVTENDGVNPEINLELLGRHSVGTGSAPQAVISSLITDPLDRAGLKITDIDKYSPEMQNPDITKPAGAGDVPLSNYKMIAALAVKRGELEKADLANFTVKHGLTGWAPTQGHIPSGVPYLGFAREELLAGDIRRVMIVGKGSLFLGRMTNLFDGVSFVVQKNAGVQDTQTGVGEEQVRDMIAKAMKEFAATLLAHAD
ncbi:glycine/sarcosine/betaine reductase complex component C subunit beta [Oscillibacter sp.]|uniref:glycine/sarcosine/betaine reductase complex component C subunit beta n=1 Tax=Oscillibacter sp. TaxID=1945593 RepID=UPI0028A8AEBD|nr:glycine/sarcosine/betaine reductase complex component C subunit beta [Oscillibacter sp.]